MDKLLHTLLDIRGIKFRLDDDFADRLSRQYTAGLLVLFAMLVSARQYMGEPIHCWCPEQCASNHEKYANIYCWVSDTYYVANEENMPQSEEPKRKITYYQWVPLILVAQSALFFLPCVIWRFLNKRSGINVGIIMEAAVASQRAMYADSREKTLRYTVHLIDRYLLAQRDTRTGCFTRLKHTLSKHCFLIYGKFCGNYLAFSYILVKLLYVGNAVGQLFLLDLALGYDFHMFGFHVVRRLMNGEDWTESDKFPRVTLCDFHIRQNTNNHRYTYQCVLPINLFNEKVFIIVWFWLLFVAAVSFLSLLHWLEKAIYWPGQVNMVKRNLKMMDTVQRETVMIKKFVDNYLRRDGVFLIRLTAKNAGDLTAMEILCGLWENYGPKHRLLADGLKSAKTDRGATKMEVV